MRAPEWSLAERVVSAYADVEGLRMAVVTGSLARGLADEASDVDVYLYASGAAVTPPPADGRACSGATESWPSRRDMVGSRSTAWATTSSTSRRSTPTS